MSTIPSCSDQTDQFHSSHSWELNEMMSGGDSDVDDVYDSDSRTSLEGWGEIDSAPPPYTPNPEPQIAAAPRSFPPHLLASCGASAEVQWVVGQPIDYASIYNPLFGHRRIPNWELEGISSLIVHVDDNYGLAAMADCWGPIYVEANISRYLTIHELLSTVYQYFQKALTVDEHDRIINGADSLAREFLLDSELTRCMAQNPAPRLTRAETLLTPHFAGFDVLQSGNLSLKLKPGREHPGIALFHMARRYEFAVAIMAPGYYPGHLAPDLPLSWSSPVLPQMAWDVMYGPWTLRLHPWFDPRTLLIPIYGHREVTIRVQSPMAGVRGFLGLWGPIQVRGCMSQFVTAQEILWAIHDYFRTPLTAFEWNPIFHGTDSVLREGVVRSQMRRILARDPAWRAVRGDVLAGCTVLSSLEVTSVGNFLLRLIWA